MLQKFMTNPLVQAFFVGRAVAEVINERVEVALTDALSELGKFDAEAREQLRQFTEEVIARANQAAAAAGTGTSTAGTTGAGSVDLQAEIDELRAEIALLRTELQKYRSSSL
jgi:demethoxyubiquinone hydroxylase (CLK1/Coq7/Cat5 family)